ncbi:transketolase [Mycoplasma sp. Mirounga ES2805-ORL]|uniref:transketolase-like TK C-terminal-containing protein n=1 Tax=Mycoplasma sp. Mirounga ES2805-ORL TaxID=754514 RepID=UPI00197C222D|nr:transketolase [Mycoplasma sp. Mirounga ES2805-ORL]QSF13579.1 transketolase [Mycoplasma sp. Mirounga ES2805-ORL]
MLDKEQQLVASMRGIAIDSINEAKGGHLGMAIGAANITYALLGKEMIFSQQDPKWMNKDRFILSAGHGSMSYYSIMHFLGLLSIEDMKSHKKLHSKTPGHPEIEMFEHVDASTGPLGQGIAMGVGMAIGQKYLQEKYNKDNYEIFNHKVFVLHGDGCLQEGVSLEAIQLAGTLNLKDLILIHDYNGIQIDSETKDVNNIDFLSYFQSNNFNVFDVERDKPKLIIDAIQKAKNSDKPSYIRVHTTIAKYAPNEGTPKGHNGVLNSEQTVEFKTKLGLKNTIPFEYSKNVYAYGKELLDQKEFEYNKWLKMFNQYKKNFPNEYNELVKLQNNEHVKYNFSDVIFEETNKATRNYFVPIMKKIEEQYPFILGGSADLAGATKIKFSKEIKDGGQYIKYGIREFAMVAINNGIMLATNMKTISSTFLVFADYEKAGLRLGSLMSLPGIHVFTHDSYGVGGDGPSHQPFDQLPMLRAMHNMKVIRPCDESEVRLAFEYALNQRNVQTSIIGCRQNIKSFNKIEHFTPAYVIQGDNKFDISLLATGSEVSLAVETANELREKYNISAQVVSVLLLQDLVKNNKLANELGLNKKPMFAIEASSDSMWYQLSKFNKIDAHLAEGFGYSTSGEEVFRVKGFTKENISKKVVDFLNENN